MHPFYTIVLHIISYVLQDIKSAIFKLHSKIMIHHYFVPIYVFELRTTISISSITFLGLWETKENIHQSESFEWGFKTHWPCLRLKIA